MKTVQFKILSIIFLFSISSVAQEFKTSLKEFKVSNDVTVAINASYLEIEIEEWNKNKVEIQGVMQIEGLSEKDAKNLFDNWAIETSVTAKNISINSRSLGFGNDYFFLHTDKYLGAINIDLPKINAQVFKKLDSLHFVLPEIEDFPDMDFDFDFDADTITFDFEKFKSNEDYLKDWQEKNKEQLKIIKEELDKNFEKIHQHQKRVPKKLIVAQEKRKAEVQERKNEIEKKRAERMKEMEKRRAEVQEKKNEMENKRAEKRAELVVKIEERNAERMAKREYQIQKIIEKRQKVKVKKVLKIKVPKNAKLQMDVNYCKISTIN